jgi:hypothetical protein
MLAFSLLLAWKNATSHDYNSFGRALFESWRKLEPLLSLVHTRRVIMRRSYHEPRKDRILLPMDSESSFRTSDFSASESPSWRPVSHLHAASWHFFRRLIITCVVLDVPRLLEACESSMEHITEQNGLRAPPHAAKSHFSASLSSPVSALARCSSTAAKEAKNSSNEFVGGRTSLPSLLLGLQFS